MQYPKVTFITTFDEQGHGPCDMAELFTFNKTNKSSPRFKGEDTLGREGVTGDGVRSYFHRQRYTQLQ